MYQIALHAWESRIVLPAPAVGDEVRTLSFFVDFHSVHYVLIVQFFFA